MSAGKDSPPDSGNIKRGQPFAPVSGDRSTVPEASASSGKDSGKPSASRHHRTPQGFRPMSPDSARRPFDRWPLALLSRQPFAPVPRRLAATATKTPLQAVRPFAHVRARLKCAVRFASRLRPSATQSAQAVADSSATSNAANAPRLSAGKDSGKPWRFNRSTVPACQRFRQRGDRSTVPEVCRACQRFDRAAATIESGQGFRQPFDRWPEASASSGKDSGKPSASRHHRTPQPLAASDDSGNIERGDRVPRPACQRTPRRLSVYWQGFRNRGEHRTPEAGDRPPPSNAAPPVSLSGDRVPPVSGSTVATVRPSGDRAGSGRPSAPVATIERRNRWPRPASDDSGDRVPRPACVCKTRHNYAAFTLAPFTLAAPAPCLQCPRRLLV